MRLVVPGGLLCAVNDALKAFDFHNYVFLNRVNTRFVFKLKIPFLTEIGGKS
jgi:hypothetical protein